MNTPALAAGIDLGGTKMAVAFVNRAGRILARQTLPTEASLGFPRAVDRLSRALEQLLARSNTPASALAGIGIGCAGPVDPARGRIHNPYTLDGWADCDIVTPLQARFKLPVFLENDADAAALGEYVAGAGQGRNPVVILTLGTGVGGGVIGNGQIYRGVNGEHPELGHIAVAPDGPACYCGGAGCLESLASGTALAAAGKAFGWMDARAVFAAAAAGHSAAQALVRRAVEAVATGAWTICHTFLPQCIVLGGGMMDEHFDLFAAAVHDRLRTATQFNRQAVVVARAALGNDAGVVGAAALAFLHAGGLVSQSETI